jgi:beta-glucosidase
MRARFRLGMFDPEERVPYASIPLEVVDSPQHKALALESARQSLVLLKNEGCLLPLNPGVRRIAVIGPNADDPNLLLGNYNGVPSQIVTPFAGILARAGAGAVVEYAAGCGLVEANPFAFGRALELAQASDLVIFVAGLSQQLEGEEGQQEGVQGGGKSLGDRQGLELPKSQEELLRAVYQTGTPVVLVLLNGSPISLRWASQHIPAILEAWYPGQSGGTAIAEALFGDYNPGGRLPLTYYASVDDLPPFDEYAMRGRTYRYFNGPVTYPFGFGLSYTKFQYSNLKINRQAEGFVIQVEIRNTGQRQGHEVVQLYLKQANPSPESPFHELSGFTRISLEAGSSKIVEFRLESDRLSTGASWILAAGGRQPRPDEWHGGNEILVGNL